MQNKIKVIQYGLGPIGNKITQYLSERPVFEIVGAIDIDPNKFNVDVGVLAGLTQPLGVTVTNNFKALTDKVDADIVVLTTTSSLEKLQPQVMEILSSGINIVSTCEELSYPWLTNPEIASEIDEKAKEYNVSVLGTGVNPGFLMDLLPIVMTGVCRDVEKVTIERIQDAQFRRIPFKKKIGASLTVEQFDQKVKEGTLRHVGLTESMHMIASKLGWKLDKTEDNINPVIANNRVETPGMVIEKGQVLGVEQLGYGYVNGEALLTLVFRAAIGQEDPRDRVIIKGSPDIDMKVDGGVNGDIATCAMIVNSIPVVINALPGLKTMADIQPVSFFK